MPMLRTWDRLWLLLLKPTEEMTTGMKLKRWIIVEKICTPKEMKYLLRKDSCLVEGMGSTILTFKNRKGNYLCGSLIRKNTWHFTIQVFGHFNDWSYLRSIQAPLCFREDDLYHLQTAKRYGQESMLTKHGNDPYRPTVLLWVHKIATTEVVGG